MHVNRANGKKYIGITSTNPLTRWAGGRGYYKNKHFYDAILKYGWDNFDHLILFSDLTKEEACKKEQGLIAALKTQDKRYGYNLTSGGEFFKHSQESKQLMSINRKGKNTGKKSAETIERIRLHHAGGAAPVSVICVESGVIYGSINDAARQTGINKKQISGCCRHVPHYNTAGTYHWKFVNEA